MNRAEKQIKLAMATAVRHFRQGCDPTEALAKAASEHSLNPDMVARAGEGFNIALINSTIAKAEDKTASFPIADIQQAVRQTFVNRPKEAAAVSPSKLSILRPRPKFAALNQEAPAPELSETLAQGRSLLLSYQSQLSKIAERRLGCELECERRMAEIVDWLSLSENQGKLAEFESQVLSEWGDQARPLLAVISGEPCDRPAPKTASIHFQPTAAHRAFDAFAKASELYWSLDAQHKAASAELAGRRQELNELTLAVQGLGPRPKQAADFLSFPGQQAVAEGIAGTVSGAYGKAHEMATEQAHKGPKDRADMEMENVQREAILRELMANDEIISRQDPKSIERTYNTLLRMSPDLTLQPSVVQSVLRSSGAQQSIDPFTAHQLSELQGSIHKNKILAKGQIAPK